MLQVTPKVIRQLTHQACKHHPQVFLKDSSLQMTYIHFRVHSTAVYMLMISENISEKISEKSTEKSRMTRFPLQSYRYETVNGLWVGVD